ncbi:MAG: Gldg family protein, partial [Thermosynechococcaceae cyanobacterium]
MKRSLPRLKGFSKLIALLLWLGVFLMVAGLCAGLISGTWSTVPVGLFIGGLVSLGGWILLRWQYSPQSSGSWWRRRSIQTGTNAVVAATSVIVILGLINFLAVRYPVKLDLTEAQIFSLAPQSKQIVRALEQPLKVLVFNNIADPQKRTLLEQYQRLNPNRFEFTFVDPQAQPGLAQKYQVKVAGTVVLDLAGRSKTLDSQLTEVNLTAAIATLVSDRKTQVFIMQGHGEMPISGAQASLADAIEELQKQGFKIDLLNFAERKQIPAETDVLVIAGPKRAFLPAEVNLLEDYMQQGGRALLMLDPETEHSLDGFLKKWGIILDERLVVDASGSGQLLGLGPAVPIVIDYGPHPITKDFAQGLTYYPIAQAL